MTFFHGNKNAATRGTNFLSRAQRAFDGRAIIRKIDNLGGKKHRTIRRRWPQQFNCIFRRDSARRVILVRAFHQMISRCPVAMAIEQRADNATIQNTVKRFVFLLGFPLSEDFAVFWKTANV